MNQKARAILQYTTYMCILTWALYRFIFLEWIAEKGFVFFFNCVGDRINCWRNCYIPSCFSRLSVTGFYFCFPILTWFQARFFSYGASFSYFLYAFLSAVTIGMYLCVQINLCMLSARTCVKLIASQHLFNGHVTWSMFLTLEEIFLYTQPKMSEHQSKCDCSYCWCEIL